MLCCSKLEVWPANKAVFSKRRLQSKWRLMSLSPDSFCRPPIRRWPRPLVPFYFLIYSWTRDQIHARIFRASNVDAHLGAVGMTQITSLQATRTYAMWFIEHKITGAAYSRSAGTAQRCCSICVSKHQIWKLEIRSFTGIVSPTRVGKLTDLMRQACMALHTRVLLVTPGFGDAPGSGREWIYELEGPVGMPYVN